jgi:Caenorhabditis protein of unknown function, DUF268
MGLVRRLNAALSAAGISPRAALFSLRGLPRYLHNKRAIENQYRNSGREFPFGSLYPCLSDRFDLAGSARGHYFHQDLHVAQLIYSADPTKHVDVASRIDGFVAHVASFVPVEVVDIRPLRSSARNITFRQMDIMQKQPDMEGYCDSLSCLHALEHFGLGRYGDPVDYYGYRTAWENITRMIVPGGTFYFSVPIGPQRIEFDAHRVFALSFLMETMISPSFEIESFAYVDDQGDMHFDEDPRSETAADAFGNRYGCGIFELRKLR